MRLSLLILLLASPVAAQPWRYVDAKGQVHYTNNPSELPPAFRARAKAVLEQKRLEAEARRAAEAAAAAAAASAPPDAPLAAAPSSAAPASTPEKKPPTAREIWQEKLITAGKGVEEVQHNLTQARQEADEASRRAIITPSGQNSAQHSAAQTRLQELEKQLQSAQQQLQDTQAAEPR